MAAPVAEGVRKQILCAAPAGSSLPKRGDEITVQCTGSLDMGGGNEKKFWSTKDPGQKPFTFRVGLGKVIKGWDDGCLTMALGEKAKLYIASDKGYGPNGFPAWGITPNADLVFEIEILSIKE